MLMYKFTQLTKTSNFCSCWLNLKKLVKSITGFMVVMLFLLSVNNLQAQEVPCIDGNTIDWGLPSVTGHPSYSYVADDITGNQDDAYHTNAKDIHDFGPGGNEWTLTSVLNKGNIMNAAALVAVAPPADPGSGCVIPLPDGSGDFEYTPGNTYLFFAGDRREKNGTAFMGFWFLINGTAPVGIGGGEFEPEHHDDDLLVLANFSKGAKFADILIYKWDGGALTDITNTTTGLAAQNNQEDAVDVPTPWEGNVKPGQIDYQQYEFYEGVIDLTTVFDLVADPTLLCNAAWMLETRSSVQLTAKLKDYAAGSFNLSPTVEVSDDTVCVGDSASLTATVKQGEMVIADPVADGYTFIWSGPGNFSGQGTATITFDPAALSDAGTYSVAVMSPNNCPPTDDNPEGTLTVNGLSTVSCPNEVTVSSCDYANQGEVDSAFSTWLDGFTYNAQVGAIVTYKVNGNDVNDLNNVTPPDVCGGSVNVMITITDDCGQDSCNQSFSVTAGAQVDVAGPEDDETGACNYADDAALQAAYTAWLAEFVTNENGCGDDGAFTGDVPAADMSICLSGSISLTYSADDGCTNDSVSATFGWTQGAQVDVAGPEDDETGACNYADDAALQAAYTAWLAEFVTNENGCGDDGAFTGDVPAADMSICLSGSISLTYSADDGCTNDSVSATFGWTQGAQVDVAGPEDDETGACNYADDAALQAAYTAWLAEFVTNENGCGDDGAFTGDVPAADMSICLSGSISLTYSADDGCTNDSVSATFGWTQGAQVDVAGPEDDETGACNYADDAALQAAYTAWLAEFVTNENGCGDDGAFTGDVPAADMSICLSGSISLTYSADDGCTNDSVSATFGWTQGAQVDVAGPEDDETGACNYADDAALQAAYTAWLAEFVTNENGCGDDGAFTGDVPAADMSICLSGSISLTYSADDGCTNDSVSATFGWTQGAQVDVAGPEDDETGACNYADDAALQAAYTAWLAEFVTNENGCGDDGAFTGDVPAADMSICLSGSISLTYSADDGCTNDSVSATFGWTQGAQVDVAGPEDDETGACNYADDAALQAAYTAWLAEFVTNENGCGDDGAFTGDVPAADMSICLSGSISLTYSADDGCTNDSVSATFGWTQGAQVDVAGPEDDETGACNYADDAALQAAYTAWLAEFVTNENGCGDDGAFTGDVPAADMSICLSGSISLTYSADDGCTNDSVSATFGWTQGAQVDVAGPEDDETGACNYADDAALQAAYTAWLAEFVTNENGCGDDGAFTGDVPAADMSICLSGSISLTYSADDGCTNDSVSATFGWTQGAQVDVAGPEDDETGACNYADDAALQAAYTAWLAEFVTNENGCGDDGAFTGDVPAADMSICLSGSISLTYSADDGCTNDSVSATFGWTQGAQVDVAGPEDDETGACNYADDAALQAAYTAWLAEFVTNENGCGDDGAFTGDVPAADMSICLSGSISLTYSADDGCTNDSVSATFGWTQGAQVDVAGPEDDETGACNYADDAALQAAYTAWLAEFVTNENGCGDDGAFTGDVPAADMSICLSGSISLTYSADDGCTNDSVSATFGWTQGAQVDVAGPEDDETGACNYADDAALQAAYTAWLAEFVTNENGCGDDGAFTGDVPAADMSICLSGSISLTYSADDGCTNDSVSATFGWTQGAQVDVAGPEDDETGACNYADDAALQAAYTAWLAEFVTNENGCGDDGAFTGDVPAADMSICLSGSISLTYSADDGCTNDSVSATFGWTQGAQVDVAGPEDDETGACNYADDAALQAAYTAWLAEFVTNENGCGDDGAFTGDVPAADMSICLSGSISLTYSADDGCTNDSVSATFGWTQGAQVDVAGPEDDETGACNYADDAALQAAYTAWLAEFVTNENGCGDDGAFTGDVPAADMSICLSGSISLTYSADDGCTNDSVSATFGWTQGAQVDVAGPEDDETGACNYADDAALQAAYTAWLAEFVTNENGCGDDGAFTGDVPAADMSICLSGSISLTYSADDGCTNDSVSATFGWTQGAQVDVAGPEDDETGACNYADDAALQAAYTAWLAEFVTNENGCGDDGAFTGDVPAADMSICLSGSISLTYSADDGCTNDSVSATFGWTQGAQVDVAGPEDDETGACNYADDAALQAAYTAWLAEFVTNENGCGDDGAFTGDVPAADMSICLSGSISLTYSADDGCTNDSVSATFGWTQGAQVDVAGPEDDETGACNYADDAALQAAYTAWLAEFVTNENGCGDDGAFTGDVPAADMSICLSGSISLTYSADDGCTNDSVSATFGWTQGAQVDVAGPEDDETGACNYADDAALQAAYTAWLAEFVTNENGCGDDGAFTGDVPAADMSICLSGSISLTYSADDGCTNDSVSATFGWTQGAQVDVAGPEDDETGACNYADDAALQAAYTAWLAEFVTNENGCGDDGAFTGDVPAADMSICLSGSISLTYSADDGCTNDSVSATFGWTQGAQVDVAGPEDVSTEECAYADDAALQAAYTAWLAEFVTNENGCGDDGAFTETPPPAASLSICSDVNINLTYGADDGCTSDEVSASFSATRDSTPPTIYEVPEDYEVCNGTAPESITLNWDDNCGESGQVTGNKTLTGSDTCSRTYTYTFSQSDRCNNNTTEEVNITETWDEYQNCETMFGRYAPSNECFIPDFRRWGWTNEISPQDEGAEPYIFNLYAGAAHCDYENRGSEVGTASVSYLDGEIYVTYNLTGIYVMNQAHIYVGCDPYPIGGNGSITVAPGQYNYNPGTGLDYVQNFTVGPIYADGDVHVIVHGVVCEATCRCSTSQGPFDYDPETSSDEPEGCDEPEPVVEARSVDFTAYPVPFDNEVNIKYSFDYETDVTVEVYDIKGSLLRTSINKNYVKGTQDKTTLDLSRTANQLFFVKLTTSNGTVVKKIVSSSLKRQ